MRKEELSIEDLIQVEEEYYHIKVMREQRSLKCTYAHKQKDWRRHLARLRNILLSQEKMVLTIIEVQK